MIKIRFILTLLSLVVAIQVTGQTYVIERVCVGSERQYRVNGEENSTYNWLLHDSSGNPVVLSNPAGTAFTLPNPDGTTTYGTQVTIQWLKTGVYNLAAIEYSVLGCDTLEQGQVEVVDPPLAFAGNPLSICSGSTVELVASSAENYYSLLWTSSGDGLFDDPSILHAIYTPGVNDLKDGKVMLTLTAQGLSSNTSCTPSVSTVEVTIQPKPLLVITNPGTVCAPAFIDLSASAITEGSTIPSSSVFSYWRDEAATNALTGETTVSVSGIYYIQVTALGGCSDIKPVQVTINATPKLIITNPEAVCLPSTVDLTATMITAGSDPVLKVEYYTDSLATLVLSNPSQVSAKGTYYIKAIDESTGCSTIQPVNVIINNEALPEFNPIANLCINNIAPVLPIQSNNGISGTWSPTTISTVVAGTSTYTFTPDIGQCAGITSLSVTVDPLITPVFDPIGPLCLGSIPPVLPATSTNGITGTWSPAIISTDLPGTVIYTFTADGVQCTDNVTLSITVDPIITALFDPFDQICLNNLAPILPLTSNNGITGTWSPTIISTITAGTTSYTFTPTDGQCSKPEIIDITISEPMSPTFAGFEPLCLNSTPPELPSTSMNGFTGTWSPSTISTDIAGTISYTFAPDEGQCSKSVTMDIITNPQVSPVFESIGPLCMNSVAPQLPDTSTNGINGSWSPSIVSTDTPGTTTYTFTPTDGQCSEHTIMNILINSSILPTFDAIGPLCLNSTAPALPAVSINGITGTWSPSIVSTETAGTATYTFTPDAGQCASSVTLDIAITPLISPTFATLGPLCLNSVPPELPTSSTNGISGTWSPAIVSTDNAAIVSYTFTPDLLLCADIITVEIEVMDSVHVTFAQDKPIIIHGGKANLTAKVTGGSGNFGYLWNDPLGQTTATAANLSAGLYKLVVTDLDGVCDPVKTTYEITEPQPFTVTAEITQPIICPGGQATITVTATGGIPPYNGAGTYQVPPGQYQYAVTDYNYIAAFSNYIEVNDPLPLKAEVASTPISCGATSDGSITVTNPTGGSRIYQVRIDGGVWNRVPNKIWNFTNLGPGRYPVQIRDASYEEDCIVTLDTIDFRIPVIPEAPVWSENGELTDCQSSPYKALNANDAIVQVSGINVIWYDAQTGGNVVSSPTLNTTGTKTYYAEATNDTCSSVTRTAVKLTINPIPDAPTASVTVQPTCTVPTGTIVVTVPNEGTGFEYSIDNGAYQPTATFNGLIPGTHQLKIREMATGCESGMSSLTVNPVPALPDAPTASVTVQPTCAVPTGTILVTLPLEGTGFEYRIDNGAYQSSVTFNGLIPGSYQLNVRELATGCESALTSLAVNPVPVLQLVPSASVIIQPDCIDPTGTIAVTDPAEGTGFEYLIDSGVYQSAGTFIGLIPGSHQLTVRETATGCESDPVFLTVNPVPVLQLIPNVSVILQPDCNVPTGTIVVTDPAEGTGYEYRIDGGAYQSVGTFNGLIPGSHQLNVRDVATNCESESVSLTVNPVPVLQLIPTVSITVQPTCFNPTGTIVVTDPAEGTGFEYRIDGGTYQSIGTFNGIIPGQHQLNVRDLVAGCESESASLMVNPVPVLQIVTTANVTIQPTCIVPTGTIDVSDPAEGTGYEYAMDGGVYQAKSTFMGLIPGSHELRIRELATGCESASSQITVNPVPGLSDAPTASVIVQPTCLIPTGTINVTIPQQGTGFEYAIDGGVFQSIDTFNGILSGSHRIKVREVATGCESAEALLTVNPIPGLPDSPIVSVTVKPTCSVPTGIVVVTNPLEGTGFEYRIDSGVYQSSGTFNGLIPGSHPIQIRDLTTGCESAAMLITVDPIPDLTMVPTASVVLQPTCIVPTGTVLVTAPQEGTGFEYCIDAGVYQSSATFNGLSPGLHQLKVRELDTGCESKAIPLTVNPIPGLLAAPTASVTVKPTCNVPTGTIVVSLPKEGTGFEYSLDGGAYQEDPVFNGLAPESIHILKVENLSTGCESLGTSLTIDPMSQNPDVPVAGVTKVPTCNNLNGTVEITHPLGANYTYSIDAGVTYQTTPIFQNLKTGKYVLLVQDMITGCVSSAGSIEVPAIPPSPVLIVAGVADSKCFGGSGTISLTVSNAPDGDYSLKYDGGQFNMNLQNGQATISALAGTYQDLTIEANSCISDKGVSATVSQPDPIVISTTITEIDLKSQTKGSIDLTVTGGNPDYQYLWHPDATIGFAGATGSMITNLNNGLYRVTVSDANGCQTDKTVVLPPPDYPPVAVNDDFTATCSGVTGNLLLKDTDPEHDPIYLILNLVRNPSHGTITLNPDQSGAFEYMVDPNYSGIDTFRYVITDTKQNLSNAALVTIHIIADFDGDGIPDDIDQDADGDGILNVDEVLPGQDWKTEDSDGDGHPNYLDIDSDNDGIVDNIEAQSTKDYIAPTGIINQYGVDYAYDPAHGGKRLIPVDTDGDGIPDFLDTDSDNDGVPDYIEGNDANHDGHPDFVLTGKDSDGDGLDDAFDTVDKCASPATNMLGSRSPLQDTDGDGIPDWRDDNDDGDKWPTRMEDWNGDGIWWNDDSNHNGIPDYLDPLSDCELFIPDAFSPNGDNIHDYFMIYCMQKYPNAQMYIFDQTGNKLFEKDHYGNLDVWKTVDQAWWDGKTTNRSVQTAPDGRVEPGTYFYVFNLGNGEVRKSYVFVSY